ncbi:MAG: hypothetical protein Q9218_006810 [Villophora microphyllina]
MNPTRHIELDIDIGADARDWSAIQAQEKLKPVETELRRVEELVSEIVTEMDYLRTREQKLRDTNESTNERVKWFAFGTMGMLVGLATSHLFNAELAPDHLQRYMVTIIVGKSGKDFYTHRDLLYDRSSYFRAALSGSFKEAQTGQIEFPNEAEAAFRLFLSWLYGSELSPPTTKEGLQVFISLLCFARTILLEELSNLCMDQVRYYYLVKTSWSNERYRVPDEDLQ